MPQKGLSTKVYIAIVLVAILAVATGAIIYTTQFSKPATANVAVGVHVGDTFTYKITGTAVLSSVDANPDSQSPNFSDLNNTDYYKVTITGINGTRVSMDVSVAFNNGTVINESQWLDVGSGDKSTTTWQFWELYPADLNVNKMLRPTGFDGTYVNSTDTQTYSTSTRQRNLFSIDNVFVDVRDPTGKTMREEMTNLYFDKQTGMLVNLNDVQYYNNPGMELIITFKLTSCSVWTV